MSFFLGIPFKINKLSQGLTFMFPMNSAHDTRHRNNLFPCSLFFKIDSTHSVSRFPFKINQHEPPIRFRKVSRSRPVKDGSLTFGALAFFISRFEHMGVPKCFAFLGFWISSKMWNVGGARIFWWRGWLKGFSASLFLVTLFYLKKKIL